MRSRDSSASEGGGAARCAALPDDARSAVTKASSSRAWGSVPCCCGGPVLTAAHATAMSRVVGQQEHLSARWPASADVNPLVLWPAGAIAADAACGECVIKAHTASMPTSSKHTAHDRGAMVLILWLITHVNSRA